MNFYSITKQPKNVKYFLTPTHVISIAAAIALPLAINIPAKVTAKELYSNKLIATTYTQSTAVYSKLTVDRDTIAPNSPITYSFTIKNTSKRKTHTLDFIGILPYNGDSRGSNFSGTQKITKIDPGFRYTKAVPNTIKADPQDPSNHPGGRTVWCEGLTGGDCPSSLAEVTAIRATADLAPGEGCVLLIETQTQGNTNGNVHKLNFIGRATSSCDPIIVPTVHTNVIGQPIVLKPKLILVKRITAINNTRFDNIVFDPATTVSSDPDNDDGNPNWPNQYLKGAGVIDANPTPPDPLDSLPIKPGDEIEYTIYFMNTGNKAAKNVRICDRLSPNQTYLGQVALAVGSNNPQLPTNNQLKYLPAGVTIPSNCGITNNVNDNGLIVLDIARSDGSVPLHYIPSITEDQSKAYGFVRFRTKINP